VVTQHDEQIAPLTRTPEDPVQSFTPTPDSHSAREANFLHLVEDDPVLALDLFESALADVEGV
jgi:hypothetical protein